jgi:glycosyltransferase involved in cell wall biosynthesis
MKPPAVSVVMPAWNAAATVGRAVRGVRAQDFSDWELVVVDDGSTDETCRAVEAAAAGDERVRLVRQAHGGIVTALRTGIAAARAASPFIARMDADDEMFPDRLGAQLAFLESHPDIGVAGSLVEFGGDPVAARGYALHVEWLNGLTEPDAIALERFVDAPVAHPSVMFRRNVLEAHGGYRETGWPEDHELWLRWMEAGVRFAKVPRVLLRWNDPPDRLSRRHASYGDTAVYDCKCHFLARWIRVHVDPGRAVLLWGAGRITRKRFAGLAAGSVDIAGYIDIDVKKTGRSIGGVPIIEPESLPGPDRCFVVGAVGVRGARELIREALRRRGFVEGRDFLMAA